MPIRISRRFWRAWRCKAKVRNHEIARDYTEGRKRTIVNKGYYLSPSDFVREAVREKLEAIKEIKLRAVSLNVAKGRFIAIYSKILTRIPMTSPMS
jgi:hypothetical protein